jgi:Fe-S-cluster containining protein
MITDASTPGDPEPAAAEALDCLTCGACCFQRPGTILVSETDLVRWKRTGRSDILARLEPGHFGQMAFVMGANGACLHHGTDAEPHACRIYDARSDTCRDFEAGSWQCLEFRRDRGIDPPLPGARKAQRR